MRHACLAALAALAIASASCGLLFGDRDSSATGGGGSGTGTGTTSSGGTGGGGIGECQSIAGSPLAIWSSVYINDLAVSGDRLFFGGCAVNEPNGGLPGVTGSSSMFLASVRAEDLCDLQVQYLGECDNNSRLRFSEGGEALLAAWTHPVGDSYRLCVAEPGATFGPIGAVTGCPPEARIACAANTLTRPSAIQLGGEIVASVQATSFNTAFCSADQTMVELSETGSGTIVIKTGMPPLATAIDTVGVSFAAAPGGALRATGVCRSTGGACVKRRLFESVDPTLSILPPMPVVLMPTWFGADQGPAVEDTAIFPTSSGWAAWVLNFTETEGGLAWAIDGMVPAGPQIPLAFPPYATFRSATVAHERGRLLVAGTSFGSFPGVTCDTCATLFGFVGEVGPASSSIERALVYPVAAEDSCSAGWVQDAIPLNDGSVIVAGSFVCAALTFPGGEPGPLEAGAIPASFLHKTSLP